MALYTLKKSDLNKTRIQDRELPEILKRNPGVSLRPGTVINLPGSKEGSGASVFGNTLKATPGTVPGLPSGIQGLTGVSSAGQGIPNVVGGNMPNVINAFLGALPTTIPSAPVFQNTTSVPTFSQTVTPPSPPSPAQRVQNEYGITQPATDPLVAAYASRAQDQARNQITGSMVSNPSVANPNPNTFQNPINPNYDYNRPTGNWKVENAGYPMPPVDDVLRNPQTAAAWRASIDSGLAATAADRWERMKQQYANTGTLMETFTPQELRWFQQFASPNDMQYWNLINQIRAKQTPQTPPPTGGGGTGYGTGYESGRTYSSSYGSTYGLINWRL